jgi:hypothetical protein
MDDSAVSASPLVESFVMRFVQDMPAKDGPAPARGWRVHVVHVQTNEEKSFANFAEAVAFIARTVPIGDFSFANDSGSATHEPGE